MRLDELGQPFVLEVNCNPCLDEGMGLARSAQKAGLSFPQLLQTIVARAEPLPYDLDIPMIGNAKHSEASAKDGMQKPLEGKLGR